MKILKIAAFAAGTLVLLLVLAVGALWLFFDPNDYKDEVQRKVHEQTGRDLALPGRISLSVFPDIALAFGPATLGNAAGFGSAPMLELERVRLGVKLRPLFSKRVEISSVEVRHPVVRLAVNRDGRDNWSDISEHMKQGASEQKETAPGGSPLEIQIERMQVVDGELSFSDARESGGIALRKLHLDAGALQAGRPTPLDFGFTYARQGGMSADVQLHAQLIADIGQQRFRFETPEIKLQARGGPLPQAGLPVTLRSPSLALDLQQQTLDWPQLQADVGGAQLSASLQAKQIVDRPQYSGNLVLAALSLREWLPRLDVKLPPTSDANALRRFALHSGFSGDAQSLHLANLDAQLDDSRLTGSAAITDFETMALQFELQLDRINVDRYMAPAPPAQAARAVAAKKPDTAPVEIPVDLLRALNAHGNVRIAQAVFAGVQFSGLRAGLEAAHGRVHLSPLEAGLYGGQYRGDVSVDAAGVPKASFNDQISNVDFAPLGKDWLKTDKLSGRGNLQVRATATGKDSDAMLRTLSGNMNLKVDNGAIEGVDLLYEIRRARAVLKKEPIPSRNGPVRTPFTQLSASGTIANGVLNTSDLVAATQLLRVNGKGSADLPGSKVDMRLDVSVLKAAEGRDLAPEMADAAGLVIPVRITGPLASPSIQPDVAGMARAVIQQKVDEKKQELEKQLRDQLGDKLKGLLGH